MNKTVKSLVTYTVCVSLCFGNLPVLANIPTQNGLNDGHIPTLNPSIETDAGRIQIDGQTNTGLDSAQNSVPIVNIAAPSAGGVSQNTFADFNVGTNGVIINNSNQNGNSNLGGAVYANPNLAPGQNANIILNEVTSTNSSNLLGATEVFGAAAEYILANPNGITCKGCEFINTPRVGLITGSSLIENGNLLGFNISQTGQIVINQGSLFGVNATNFDAFDIVSRAVKINGEIYANNLQIKAGNGFYDQTTKQLSSVESSNKPTIAIDSSVLGGMHAGRITIVSSESGVGVNLGADAVAYNGDLTVSANGEINYTNLASNASVNLIAKDLKSEKTDTILANSDINIYSQNGYKINGQITANRDLTIISEGDITNKTDLEIGRNFTVQTNGDFLNGSIDQNPDITLQKADFYAILAGNIEISAKNVFNYGALYSAGDINIFANETVQNRSTFNTEDEFNFAQIFANNNLNIFAKNITNLGGELLSNNDINFFAEESILNAAIKIGSKNTENNYISSFIDANNDINIETKTLINQGYNYDLDDSG